MYFIEEKPQPKKKDNIPFLNEDHVSLKTSIESEDLSRERLEQLPRGM